MRAAPCLNLDELDAHSNLKRVKVEELIENDELFTLKKQSSVQNLVVDCTLPKQRYGGF